MRMTFSARKLPLPRRRESLREWMPAFAGMTIIIMLGLYNACGNMFMQDDAYISYNYAKWFSRGYGLVWYPGSTEFGYTNFFYTLMIGVGMIMGIPPEWASNAINMASFVGCLILTYHIAKHILGSASLALLPVLLLATHHSFTSYATGGLETMWVTLLVLGFYWQLLRADPNQLIIGTLAAIALLSRLDAAVLLLPGYVYLARRNMWQAAIIPVLTTLGFLLICTVTYGHPLPTSFDVKMPGGGEMLGSGLRYLWLYVLLHLYLPLMMPLIVIYFFATRERLQRVGGQSLLIGSVLLLWLCYIVYVGGDFMEFRFLVPVLAFYSIVIVRLLQLLVPLQYHMRALVIVTLLSLLSNAAHPAMFETRPNKYDRPDSPKPFYYAFVENTEMLGDWLHAKNTNWILIGKALNRYFANVGNIHIAVNAAGAIAYYSELPIIDGLGLNTRAVVDDHVAFQNRPGHYFRASDALLKRFGVNVNIAHPETVCEAGPRLAYTPNVSDRFFYQRHQTLFIPLDNGCFVVADYITPHPAIDALIQQQVILRYRDVASRTSCPAWLCLR